MGFGPALSPVDLGLGVLLRFLGNIDGPAGALLGNLLVFYGFGKVRGEVQIHHAGVQHQNAVLGQARGEGIVKVLLQLGSLGNGFFDGAAGGGNFERLLGLGSHDFRDQVFQGALGAANIDHLSGVEAKVDGKAAREVLEVFGGTLGWHLKLLHRDVVHIDRRDQGGLQVNALQQGTILGFTQNAQHPGLAGVDDHKATGDQGQGQNSKKTERHWRPV